MNFTTKVPIQSEEPKIGYDSRILLLGSCFVENIGRKFGHFKFQILQNPFGILFHPKDIALFLENVRNQRKFTDADIFFHNERWHSFQAHSNLSDIKKEALLHKLNTAIHTTDSFIRNATHVIITLGTAWGYRHRVSGQKVANCHKLPQTQFSKELMNVGPALQSTIEIIKTLNPEVSLIFTVSPVRHLKDGFVENQLSKALLISAVAEATGENVSYFPSYEIMMDELRDYRFYAEDLVHPNDTAISYIWERFAQTWISPESLPIMQEVDQIAKGLLHRPFNPDSQAHRKFLDTLKLRMERLQKTHPNIKFSE